MRNVDMRSVYNEIKLVRKKLEHLEEILIPVEELSAGELAELNELRAEALGEHKRGQTVKVQDL